MIKNKIKKKIPKNHGEAGEELLSPQAHPGRGYAVPKPY